MLGQFVEKRAKMSDSQRLKKKVRRKGPPFRPYSHGCHHTVVHVFNPALQKKGVKAAPWDPDIN